MIPRYLQKRSSKAKTFSQVSMTIPGLAVDIRSAIAAAQRGEPCRQHKSGSYDDISDTSEISPFQRGFEMTDFAPNASEANKIIDSYEAQHKAKRKNVAPSHTPPTAPPEAEPEQPAND